MKNPDRFERAVKKITKSDTDIGYDSFCFPDDVIVLLRQEHTWMRRMVQRYMENYGVPTATTYVFQAMLDELSEDGMIPMCEAPSVKLSDAEQALAEKDQEIAYLNMRVDALRRFLYETLASRAKIGTAQTPSLRAYIEQLEQQNAALREALQALYDVQNGCPLPKYQADWDRAMQLTQQLLKETDHEPLV